MRGSPPSREFRSSRVSTTTCRRDSADVHPQWGTPWAALVLQAAITAVFVFLGQAGTSVRGAYDALVR